MNEPTVMAGGFLYEEGEGLEDDEAAANAALLPRPLAELPGGGLGHGVLANVRDQSQDVSLQLVIEHQARPCGGMTLSNHAHRVARTSAVRSRKSNTARSLILPGGGLGPGVLASVCAMDSNPPLVTEHQARPMQ